MGLSEGKGGKRLADSGWEQIDPMYRGRGSTACCPRCRSAKRPAACAKVQKWMQVSGGGWQPRVAGGSSAQGETGDRIGCLR